MKTKKIKNLFLTLIILTLISCNADVFYKISKEDIPRIPMIEGSPTNFILFNNVMYVAGSHKKDKKTTIKILASYSDGNWVIKEIEKEKVKQDNKEIELSSNIIQLAATNTDLYAIAYLDTHPYISTKLMKITLDNEKKLNWTQIDISDDYKEIQAIYTVNETIYLLTKKNNVKVFEYAVFSYDGINSPQILFSGETPQGKTLTMTGAILSNDGTIFLCTDNGIYKEDGTLIEGTEGMQFTGIIKLDDGTIIAIARDNILYQINSNGITERAKFYNDKNEHDTSRWASGAIALCNNGNNKFLLVGRQDKSYSASSGYIYGYVEMQLGDSGEIINNTFKEPGIGDFSSIWGDDANERYISSLGIHPVNHICQAPDGVLFAATQQNGVWAFRERDDGWSWNAEEKPE